MTLIGVIGILVGIYFILKKDLCGCANPKKKDDAAEETEEESELDEDIKENASQENEENLLIEDQESAKKDFFEEGDEAENQVPDIVITKTSFTAGKLKKSSSLKSVFKRITKPIGKVRFGGVSSKSGVEQYPLVGSNGEGYGSLHPMQRSDSMESFLSGISVVSENIEEFGEELSPGRLQTTLEYDKREWKVIVGVKQAECLIHTGSEKIYWQVHVTFLPFKKHRFKTKYKSTATPIFNQTFEVEDVAEQALGQIAIRFRVYGKVGRTGKKKLAGETEINLSCLKSATSRLLEWNTLKRKKQIKKLVS